MSGSRRTLRRGRAALVLVAAGWMTSACMYGQSFSCKGYPEGIRCQDVMTVYENRYDLDRLPLSGEAGSGSGEGVALGATALPAAPAEAPPGLTAPDLQVGQPALTPPRIARVWIAPWRDEKNRLHEASLLYMMVAESDWAYGPRRRPVVQASRGNGTLVPTISSMIERPGQRRASGAMKPPGDPVTGRPDREDRALTSRPPRTPLLPMPPGRPGMPPMMLPMPLGGDDGFNDVGDGYDGGGFGDPLTQ